MDAQVKIMVEEMLKGLQFGEIKISVQNGKIMDIVKTERVRVGK